MYASSEAVSEEVDFSTEVFSVEVVVSFDCVVASFPQPVIAAIIEMDSSIEKCLVYLTNIVLFIDRNCYTIEIICQNML